MSMAAIALVSCSGKATLGTGPDLDFCTPATDASASFSGPGSSTSIFIGSRGRITGLGYNPDVEPGIFVLTLDFTEFSTLHDEATFRLPLPPGADVDLHMGDIVDVTYDHTVMGAGPRTTELSVTRDGTLLVYALRSNWESILPDARGAVTLDILQGTCESVPDGTGCILWARHALRAACDATGDLIDVFDGNEGLLACGPGYYVVVGSLVLRTDDVAVCADVPSADIEVVILRHGDGLPSP